MTINREEVEILSESNDDGTHYVFIFDNHFTLDDEMSTTLSPTSTLQSKYKSCVCIQYIKFTGENRIQIYVPRSMSSQFRSMRESFGTMFSKFRNTIIKHRPSLKHMKTFLEDYYPNLDSQLPNVRSHASLLRLIREKCTLIDIGIIENVLKECEITKIDEDVSDYKKEIDRFCKSISVQLCLKEKFDVVKKPSLLQCETATFVLDWDPGEGLYTLDDINNLMSKALEELHRHVHTEVIIKSKSITITCSFPVSLTSPLIAIALKNIKFLKEKGLLELTIGYCTLYNKEKV